MTVRYIQQFFFTLLAVAFVFSTSGCRDFGDSRTPYKSFVTVAFCDISGKDHPDIVLITDAVTDKSLTLCENKVAQLPLNPDTDVAQFKVYRFSSSDVAAELTIHYQREGVLISHQRGGTQKYVLKRVAGNFIREYKILNKELSTLNDSRIDVQIYL
ncbi:MAG: hypothetical protein MUC61_01000 [Amoebophilaceae bacterium]|jgi:hypothetical protein|nr:hypothetical protein [Amoebophilaceae bacterium]